MAKKIDLTGKTKKSLKNSKSAPIIIKKGKDESKLKAKVIKQKDLLYLEKQGDKYLLKLANSDTLETHLNVPFPPLSYELSTILKNDLLLKPEQIKDNNYRNSLVYCLISTLSHSRTGKGCGNPDCHANHSDFTIELDEMIQWDQAFRLDPNPGLMVPQMRVIQPLKDFLKDDYKDLPFNYRSSIEEMSEDDGFVGKNTIKKLNNVLHTFDNARLFSVSLINNLYYNFSISLTILLISEIISPEGYFRAALCFIEEKKSDKLSPDEKKRLLLFDTRMQNLYKALDSNDIAEFIN